MKKVLVTLLIFLSLIALILRFGYQPLIKMMGLTPKAGVRIESNHKAKVFLDSKEVGVTPYQDEGLAAGEFKVLLEPLADATSSAKASWQGFVKLNSGTLTIVNRDLQDSQAKSSGEVITLEKGQGATIISTPTGAQVTVDGKEIGRTPVSLPELGVGEHQFLIGKENFLKRSIRATVVKGFNLTLNVDLALSEVDLTKIPTEPITTSSSVVVKQTPVGFLRVRSAPNTNSSEVSRVAPGTTLTLIEDGPEWDRVRLPDGKEGYVSSVYVEKKN